MARWLGFVLLLLVAGPVWTADSGLGRLFFTPAERQALEDARKKNIRAEVQAAEKPAPPPVRNVSVTGLVRRSDGESTVWVNGKAIDGTTPDGLKVRVTAGQGGSVIVHEPAKGHTVRLKVGQRADILTGRIEEGYERREAAAPQVAPPDTASAPGEPPQAPPSRKPPEPAYAPDQTRPSEGAESAEAGEDERR